MEVLAGKPSGEMLDYLLRRRSVLADDLSEPAPSGEQLEAMLSAAARVPDHGKAFPFYFIVFEGNARAEMGDLIAEAFVKNNPDAGEEKIEVERGRFMRAPLVVAIVSRIRPSKHPAWEQFMSAGAAAQNFSLAAHAQGFGVHWLSEWYTYDSHVRDGLGLDERDTIAGFMYVGTPAKQPEERDRPELSKIVTRWSRGGALNKGDNYDREKLGFPRKGFSIPVSIPE